MTSVLQYCLQNDGENILSAIIQEIGLELRVALLG